ncbi:MAG: hypothetical protein MZU91_13065 [Desulfosudis oleivorans]|nr:hypothetical protein [Desulfosudis oleivorans]
MQDLSNLLGMSSTYGFARTDPFSGVTTARKGIYASGAAAGPRVFRRRDPGIRSGRRGGEGHSSSAEDPCHR